MNYTGGCISYCNDYSANSECVESNNVESTIVLNNSQINEETLLTSCFEVHSYNEGLTILI